MKDELIPLQFYIPQPVRNFHPIQIRKIFTFFLNRRDFQTQLFYFISLLVFFHGHLQFIGQKVRREAIFLN